MVWASAAFFAACSNPRASEASRDAVPRPAASSPAPLIRLPDARRAIDRSALCVTAIADFAAALAPMFVCSDSAKTYSFPNAARHDVRLGTSCEPVPEDQPPESLTTRDGKI